MFTQWIQNFSTSIESDDGVSTDLTRISTLLLLEVARADAVIDEEERQKILDTYTNHSTLDEAELQELLTQYEQEVDASISFHEHIRAVNKHFDKDKKLQLIRQMWQVAFADECLSEYEEAFIRQVADLIHVRHKDFIQQKLIVTNAI